MKNRLISELKKGLIIICVGALYYLAVTKLRIGLPCIFNAVTGLLCPACGITRMVISALRLDFHSAFGYNKALFVTFPVILYILVSTEIEYIKTGKRTVKPVEQFLLWGEIALLMLFGIVRNII